MKGELIMNKNVRRLLSIIIATLMCINHFHLESIAADNEFQNELISDIFEIQLEALRANDELFCSFDWSDGYVYPEDFAGTFIDYDTLHVMLTSYDNIEKYNKILENYSKVTFDLANYSYVELFQNVKNTAENCLDIDSLTSYGVDVRNNIGFIGVLKEYYDYASNYSSDKISIVIKEPVVEDTSLSGGSPISSNGFGFTLAAGGTYNGNNVFLTSGHNMTIGSSVTWYGNTIGSFSLVQFNDYQTGDYAFINCSNSFTPSTSFYVDQYNNTSIYTGYFYNPPAGTYLIKYGKTTYQTTCQVQNTGITVIANGKIIQNLTQANGTSSGGDSGGLYRYNNMFCGVHHGHDQNNNSIIYFTPYVYPNAAGFTVLTN